MILLALGSSFLLLSCLASFFATLGVEGPGQWTAILIFSSVAILDLVALVIALCNFHL